MRAVIGNDNIQPRNPPDGFGLTCNSGICYIFRSDEVRKVCAEWRKGFISMNLLRISVVLLACTVIQSIGCQSRPIINWNWVNDRAWAEWRDDDRYMTTWHEKEAFLEELRQEADSLPVAEQRQHAIALSEQIKAEEVPVVRRELVRTLAHFYVVESEAGLKTALEDSDPDIRSVACKAMGARPGQSARNALLKVVRSDEDTDVQSTALRALGNFDGQEVFDELKKALENRDPAVQYAGIQGLRTLTGQDWGEDPETWLAGLDGKDPEVIHDGRESFIDALHPRNLLR
tara:strand:+ start:8504 stop:9367 length:864 start_codon:yes stop_codon:yes gene_type:complete